MKVTARLFIDLICITLVATQSIGQQVDPNIDAVNFVHNLRSNIIRSNDMFSESPNVNYDISSRCNIRHQMSQSKVIKQSSNFQKLMRYFPQAPKSAVLCYRASENNFSVLKFNQKCGKTPHTLTIVENSYDKIVGGYTPLTWARDFQYHEDKTRQSFLFSLTNDDKFPLTDFQWATIYSDDEHGPTFGAGHDLFISDQADKQGWSYANIGKSFTNCKYTHQSQASQQKFTGQGVFTVKQWEVWVLTF